MTALQPYISVCPSLMLGRAVAVTKVPKAITSGFQAQLGRK